FFSSRRRHTRSKRDWSSDVCSSDLGTAVRTAFAALGAEGAVLARSGAESALMAVNYGSVAKLEALDLAVEAFGPRAVQDLTLPRSEERRVGKGGRRRGAADR